MNEKGDDGYWCCLRIVLLHPAHNHIPLEYRDYLVEVVGS